MRTEAEINLHRIWRETNLRLDVLSQRVAENKDLAAALEFSRWLFWSGILDLLEANPSPEPLKVDGSHLRWKCEELGRAVTARWAQNDSEPHVATLQLQSINEKLDAIAGYLSRVPVSAPRASLSPRSARRKSKLKVISGGLENGAVDGDKHREVFNTAIQPQLSRHKANG